MEKLILEPVKVPWKISSSDEIGTFQYTTNSVQLFLIVDIVNDLSKLLRETENPNIDIYDGIDMSQICLTFNNVLYFEFSKPQKIVFGLDQKRYDFRGIDASDRDLFFKKWFSTQLCPRPNMFWVKNSDIKKQLNIGDDSKKHWLLTGHNESVNVVAEAFSWKVVEHLK